jgi:hypothetical protein
VPEITKSVITTSEEDGISDDETEVELELEVGVSELVVTLVDDGVSELIDGVSEEEEGVKELWHAPNKSARPANANREYDFLFILFLS